LNEAGLNEAALNEARLNGAGLNQIGLDQTALKQTASNQTALNQTALNQTALNRGLIAGVLASLVGQLFLSITQPTLVDHPTCILIAGAMALSFRLAASGGSPEIGAEHGV
jgi:hypothetical protein